MDMQDISFKHKLEVHKSGWAYYDVAEGDVVEIHYDAHSVSVGHTVGKITEIGVESIIVDSCMRAEKAYNYLISEGRTPQEARSVLPNSLKTEVVMTANLREWRHFLSLRACGSTGKPHPQMLEVAVPLLKELRERVPVVFDDLEPMEWETVK